MHITLPRRGRGGGGPGRHGGRDGRRGRGGRGGPLPSCERNPMLLSNSRNSTLATSISPLPCTPAPSAAVPPPSSCCRWAPVCYCCCVGAGLDGWLLCHLLSYCLHLALHVAPTFPVHSMHCSIAVAGCAVHCRQRCDPVAPSIPPVAS